MQRRTMLVLLATPAALLGRAVRAQASPPVRVRGEITAVEAAAMTVRERSGATLRIALKPDQSISSVRKLALADLKPGTYVGTATHMTSAGEMVALEVLVFPEAARGTGEGHREWDLAPGSMMTNANVDSVVEHVTGRTMKLSYQGGSQDVSVPEGTPIVTPAPASREDLVVGRKVFAFVQGDAPNFSAARIYVEKDGVVPPM